MLKSYLKVSLFLAMLLAFLPCVFAQSNITPQEMREVVMYYYQKPQPDKLLIIVRMILNEVEVNKDTTRYATIKHFISAVAHKDPLFLAKLKSLDIDLTDSASQILALILEEANNFRSSQPILPEGLDLLWSEFTATGDVEPVKKIISIFDRAEDQINPSLIQAAKMSLSVGALMHQRVHDIIREAYRSSQGIMKESLLEVLKNVDTQKRGYAGRYGYSDQKFVDEKIVRINQAIEANPQDENNYLSRGIAYANNQEIENALSDFLKALELNPNLPVAHNYVCWIYVNQDRLEEAKGHCEKALELTENYGAPHYNLATIFLKRKEYREALDHATKAIEFEPRNFDRYLLRAGIYESQGDFLAATKDLKKAIELNPKEEIFIKNKLEDVEEKLARSVAGIVLSHGEKGADENQGDTP